MGYYLSGSKDNGSETVTCDDSEAQFWTLYVCDEAGLSQGIIDCVFREDAEAAMAVYVERDALQEQVRALAAENSQMLRLLTDISENHDEYVNQDEYLYAGVPMDYVSEINMYVSRDVNAENPFESTDAAIREIRAQAVELEAMKFHEKAFVAFENSKEIGPFIRADLQQSAARIRAGEAL